MNEVKTEVKKVGADAVLTLTVKNVGKDGFWELRDQLSEFVRLSFDTLYEGACRMGAHIPQDYYAGRRIQIRDTRLNASIGVKYADGHKYSSEVAPTEEQLRNTVSCIQRLLDEAGKDIKAPFQLTIKEN